MTMTIDQIIDHLDKQIKTAKRLCLDNMRNGDKESAAHFRGRYQAFEHARDLLKAKKGAIKE